MRKYIWPSLPSAVTDLCEIPSIMPPHQKQLYSSNDSWGMTNQRVDTASAFIRWCTTNHQSPHNVSWPSLAWLWAEITGTEQGLGEGGGGDHLHPPGLTTVTDCPVRELSDWSTVQCQWSKTCLLLSIAALSSTTTAPATSATLLSIACGRWQITLGSLTGAETPRGPLVLPASTCPASLKRGFLMQLNDAAPLCPPPTPALAYMCMFIKYTWWK